jgi:tRNA pseudouridine55 synthase
VNDPKLALPNGILVVDKPIGPTSHDIVAQARRFFKTKRVGHAGTLDPMASGVLLILLGEATKLSNALSLERKRYLATIAFGTSTDSDDALGKVIEQVDLPDNGIEEDALNAALEIERYRTSQIPPIVSAIKHEGMTAHRRLRKGLTVEVSPRQVRVFELRQLSRTKSTVDVSVDVSKGYYVRSLARDLGSTLGIPAHLAALRRTASGVFDESEAVKLPLVGTPQLLSLVETVKRCIPYVQLTDEGTTRAKVGKIITVEHLQEPKDVPLASIGTVAWLSPNEALIALGQFDEAGLGRVQRGFGVNESNLGQTELANEKI